MNNFTENEKKWIVLTNCLYGKTRELSLKNNDDNNCAVNYNQNNINLFQLIGCINLGTSIIKDSIYFYKINELIEINSSNTNNKENEYNIYSIYKRFYEDLKSKYELDDEKINKLFILSCKIKKKGGLIVNYYKDNNDDVNDYLFEFITNPNNKKINSDLKNMINYAKYNLYKFDFTNIISDVNNDDINSINEFNQLFSNYIGTYYNQKMGFIKENNIKEKKKDDFDLSSTDSIYTSIKQLEEEIEKLEKFE